MTEKPGRRFFTAGAVVLFVEGLAHSLSFFEKPVPRNETERQLMELMTNYKFDLIGSMRTMDDLMRGFSMSFMLAMFVMGSLAMLLVREQAGLVKRAAFIYTIWLALMNVVSFVHFFVIPTSLLVAAFLMFGLAWMTLPGSAQAGSARTDPTQTGSTQNHAKG